MAWLQDETRYLHERKSFAPGNAYPHKIAAMETLKFLQIAPLTGGGAWAPWINSFPLSSKILLRMDTAEALRNAADLAIQEAVDVVICPDGLWNEATITPEAAVELYDILGSMAPRAVVVIPGVSDPFHPYSYHSSRYLELITGRSHPANVTVVHPAREEPQSIPVAGLPNAVIPARPDLQPRHRIEMTSGENQRLILEIPTEWKPAPPAAFPVSDQLVTVGRLRAVTGQVTREGVQQETLRELLLDSRRIVRIAVSLDQSVQTAEDLMEKISTAGRAGGVTPQDLFIAAMSGTTSPHVLALVLDMQIQSPDGEWFHLVPEYDGLSATIPAAPGPSGENDQFRRLEDRFISRVSLQGTDSGRNTDSRLVAGSLCMGLQALQRVASEMRHVD